MMSYSNQVTYFFFFFCLYLTMLVPLTPQISFYKEDLANNNNNTEL